jgi:hypothetical protein
MSAWSETLQEVAKWGAIVLVVGGAAVGTAYGVARNNRPSSMNQRNAPNGRSARILSFRRQQSSQRPGPR